MTSDPTLRFTSRVDNYRKYRPGYPAAVLEVMRDTCGLQPVYAVADVGSGTGIFSELLHQNGNRVFGVEPNAAMRSTAERLLAGCARFVSVNGTAEATTLPDHHVRLVTAAQAFHWFNRERTRAEFARILEPRGWVVLVWNDRRVDTTPFLRAYEELLMQYGTDYREVRHRDLDLRQVQDFIGSEAVVSTTLENRQWFNYEGVRGRLLSSSYAPEPGHPNHEPMLARLAADFDEHQVNRQVSFEYDTHIYCAQLPPG